MTNEIAPAKRSPFKFLDPYGPEDGDIYFGRKAEVAELYAKLYSAPVTVIYGESGTGKTSLIQCGLRNCIPLEDMLFVFIRITDKPNDALRQALLKAAPQISDGGEDMDSLLRRVVRRSYKTVLLVFDQFEEFLLFQPEEVRRQFITQLAQWLEEGLNLRIMFAIRQEYFAQLTALEEILPGLYDNRLWLRRMSREQAEEVITSPCAKNGIDISPTLVGTLLNVLNTNNQGIDLPILQVVLDSLYRHTLANSDSSLALREEAYLALGQINSILGRFLNERIATLGEQAEIAKQILKTLVSSEATRRPATQQDIVSRLARDFRVTLSNADSTTLLETLVQERILRVDSDRHCYELRHDSLAPHVRGWMSVLEQEMEALRESLEQRFRDFQRNRRLLDTEFLAELSPYENRLTLEAPLAAFVQSSKDALQKETVRQQEEKATLKKKRQCMIVVVAGFFFLVSSSFGGFSYEQWQNAKKQRAEAERQKQQAEANFHKAGQLTYDFYTLVNENELFNAPGLDPLRRQLLEKTLKYSDELSRQQMNDVEMRLVLAKITFSVAKMRQVLGDSRGAEEAHRRCIDLYKALADEYPDIPDYQSGLAESRSFLGNLQKNSGDTAGARESYRTAMDISKRLVKKYPDEPDYQNILAQSYSFLGNLEKDSGDVAEARELYSEALRIREQLVKNDPNEPKYQNGLAWNFNSLGNLQKDTNDVAEARESYNRALRIREQLVKNNSNEPKYQNGLASSLNSLGNLQKDNDDKVGAEESFRKALHIRELLAKAHPDVPNYQNGLAESYNSLGTLQKDSDDSVRARKSYNKALKIYESLVKEHPDEPKYHKGLAESYNNLGELEEKVGDLTGAREALEQAAELYKRLTRKYPLWPAYRRDWAAVEGRLAWIELLDRKPQAAIASATHALEIDPKQTKIKARLAHGLLFNDQYAKALVIYMENQDAKLEGGKIFAQTVLDDFKKLRAKGITIQDIAKIKKRLGKGASQIH
jgi:tetratricopeptide (TPR) repeat protein